MHVKNKDLLAEIIISKKEGELTPKALDMFILMNHRFSWRLSYMDEEDRKDCIAGGIMDCWLYWDRFDPSVSSNPFSYFTQVLKNGMVKQFNIIYGKCPKSSKISISMRKIYNL